MANLDSNLNPRNDIPCTVSFSVLYDKSEETLKIGTPKINNLKHENVNKTLRVLFTVKDWTCETPAKTARTSDVIWNEHFTNKVKYKHIAGETLEMKVLDDQDTVIGSAVTLDLKDVKVDEKTCCSFSIESKGRGKGEIIFRIVPTDKSVTLTIIKAKDLPRVMNEYTVLARLLSSKDSEKKTKGEKSAFWNEEIVFKGAEARKGVLILQVLGERTDEKVMLGEARLNIPDVKHREHGRILALREPEVDSISFSTTTKEEDQTVTLNIRVFGLENIKATSDEKTKVYVQIKQKCEGVVIKKEKTSKVFLSDNPSFKSSVFSFTFTKEQRNNTKFVFSVKTQKSAYDTDKPVIGKVTIGPFSEGRWYKEVLQVKNREIPHSLHLEMY